MIAWMLLACVKPTPSGAAATAPWQGPEARLAGTTEAVAYSGYREGQHPDRGDGEVLPSREETLEDLRLLARDGNFPLIRVYDAGAQTRQVLEVLRDEQLPIKVMLGAWLAAELSNHEDCAWLSAPIPDETLAANALANAAQVESAIALVHEFPEQIVAVNVGNEALVTWNDHLVSIDAMVGYLTQVREAVDVPVTTADNYVAWTVHADALTPVVDLAMVHTYPQWEGHDLDTAMPYTLENLQAVRTALPDTPLVVGEAGWASHASEFGERASEAKQHAYVDALTGWARDANVTTFVFEAFDEPWKGDPGNPDGAEKHWGLFTVDRKPKAILAERY